MNNDNDLKFASHDQIVGHAAGFANVLKSTVDFKTCMDKFFIKITWTSFL